MVMREERKRKILIYKERTYEKILFAFSKEKLFAKQPFINLSFSALITFNFFLEIEYIHCDK